MVLNWDQTVSFHPELSVIKADRVDPDQTPCSMASDLDLLCL